MCSSRRNTSGWNLSRQCFSSSTRMTGQSCWICRMPTCMFPSILHPSFAQVYQYQVLPFGLKDSPWVFTRLVAVLIASLRQSGIQIFHYLDDWLLVANSRSLLELHLQKTLELTHRLGFLVNLEKSSLTPSQIPSFLGASLDIPRLLAHPLPHRVVALQSLVQEITAHWFSPAKTWQVFLGHLASFTDLIPLCRLIMRPLQLHFLKFFSPCREIPSRPVPLSPQIKSLCLLWGSQEFLLQGKSFSPPPPRLLISSDASNLGWGAFLHPYHVSGVWSPQESRLHINSLELLAVFLALQSFEDLIFGQSILIRSDNSTVVSYINRQGGTHSPSLCNLTLDLWDWCRERGIHLSASHVPGEDNLLADFLSRGKFLPSEWTLNHSVFQRICLAFPPPEIDLFASALTFQLPK